MDVWCAQASNRMPRNGGLLDETIDADLEAIALRSMPQPAKLAQQATHKLKLPAHLPVTNCTMSYNHGSLCGHAMKRMDEDINDYTADTSRAERQIRTDAACARFQTLIRAGTRRTPLAICCCKIWFAP